MALDFNQLLSYVTPLLQEGKEKDAQKLVTNHAKQQSGGASTVEALAMQVLGGGDGGDNGLANLLPSLLKMVKPESVQDVGGFLQNMLGGNGKSGGIDIMGIAGGLLGAEDTAGDGMDIGDIAGALLGGNKKSGGGGLDLGGLVGGLLGGGKNKQSGGGLDLGGLVSGLLGGSEQPAPKKTPAKKPATTAPKTTAAAKKTTTATKKSTTAAKATTAKKTTAAKKTAPAKKTTTTAAKKTAKK